MPEIVSSVPKPILIHEPYAAELSEAGHWGETQLIQSIKDANWSHKCPDRAFHGKATITLGGGIASSGPMEGRLVTPKLRKRTRLRRWLGYLS
jgi:hypothetical protein